MAFGSKRRWPDKCHLVVYRHKSRSCPSPEPCTTQPLQVLEPTAHTPHPSRKLGTDNLTSAPASLTLRPPAALSSAVHVDLALTRVSDTGLMALAAGSPLLCRLVLSPCDSYNLWGTGRWTAAGLEAFRRLRPEVAVVTVEC